MKIFLVSFTKANKIDDIKCLPETVINKERKFYRPDFFKNLTAVMLLGARIKKNCKYVQQPFTQQYIDKYMAGLLIKGSEPEFGNYIPFAFDKNLIIEALSTPLLVPAFQITTTQCNALQSNSYDFVFNTNLVDLAIEKVSKYFTLKTGDKVLISEKQNVFNILNATNKIGMQIKHANPPLLIQTLVI